MPTNNESRIELKDILIVDDEIARLKLRADVHAQHGYQVRPPEMQPIMDLPSTAIPLIMAYSLFVSENQIGKKSTNASCRQ